MDFMLKLKYILFGLTKIYTTVLLLRPIDQRLMHSQQTNGILCGAEMADEPQWFRYHPASVLISQNLAHAAKE